MNGMVLQKMMKRSSSTCLFRKYCRQSLRYVWRLKYILLFLVIAGSYLMVNALKLQAKPRGIQAGMAVLLGGAVIFMLVMRRQKRWTQAMGIRMVLLMGLVMRIGYMLYTPATLRGHDLFELETAAYGKAGYLLRLAVEGRLPETNLLQLYQQPFFFISGAFCSRILNWILGRSELFYLVDAAKVVSCFASCMTLLLAKKLFHELGISLGSTLFGMMLVAFAPVFYLTGGRMSEDALCTFFMLAVLLYTLYWEKEPGWKNTVLLALLYGFGMMTKISLAVPAMYTAWIFLKKLFLEKLWGMKKEERKNIRELMGQLTDKESLGMYLKMLAFSCISLPMGLWYSLRNRLLFQQSLTYVLEQDVNGPLYRGKEALVQRFLLPDVGNLLETPYANPFSDHNLFTYLLKTELFGEFQYQIPEWIPILLLFLNLIISVAAVGYCVGMLRKKGERAGYIPVVWMLLFAGFTVNSYLSYPFGCTMDFRYYTMLTVCKALLIGKLLDGAAVNNRQQEVLLLQSGLKKAAVCFGIFSCVMYCMI